MQSLKCVFRAGGYPPTPLISFTHHLPIIYAAYCVRCDEIMQSLKSALIQRRMARPGGNYSGGICLTAKIAPLAIRPLRRRS